MRRLIMAILIIAMAVHTTACGSKDANPSENEDTHPETADISTWVIPDGARFVPVDLYRIEDGTVIGMTFVTYVDLANGCMYMYTGQYQSGYGTALTKLTDENNNACIYKELDVLRKKHAYKDNPDSPQEDTKQAKSEEMAKAKLLYDTASDVL